MTAIRYLVLIADPRDAALAAAIAERTIATRYGIESALDDNASARITRRTRELTARGVRTIAVVATTLEDAYRLGAALLAPEDIIVVTPPDPPEVLSFIAGRVRFPVTEG